jgi:hypothetical protein
LISLASMMSHDGLVWLPLSSSIPSLRPGILLRFTMMAMLSAGKASRR